MTQKEIFLLTIIFQKIGLNKKEIKKLLATCTSKGDTYNIIINAINKLQGYFIGEKNYDKETLYHILKGTRIYGCGIDKIKQVEDIFKAHDYTRDEIKTIETIHPIILCHEKKGLRQKTFVL